MNSMKLEINRIRNRAIKEITMDTISYLDNLQMYSKIHVETKLTVFDMVFDSLAIDLGI